MKRNRIKIAIFIFSIVVIVLPKYIPTAEADVISIYQRGAGSFFPVENCSLIMTNANVILDINFPNINSNADLTFNGNYTIYNPGESINLTLIAPFSPDFENLESTCTIEIEENGIAFDVVDTQFYENPWGADLWEYLDTWYQSSRKFVVFNVTIANDTSLEIKFNFEATLSYIFDSNDYFRIFYDVGTSRAWNGTITERVEFRTYGELPDSYADYGDYHGFQYNCTISDIENGKSYVWEWDNERIMSNSVYISYKYPWSGFRRLLPLIIFVIIPSVILGVTAVVLIIRKRRRKAKNETINSNERVYDDQKKPVVRQRSKFCTNCGKPMEPKFKVCPYCGFSLVH